MTAELMYQELKEHFNTQQIAQKLHLHTGTLKRWEATQKIPNEYLYDLNFLLGNKYDLQKVDFRPCFFMFLCLFAKYANTQW
ncbi:hypothetical protein [Helicobacter fennelliae]